MKIRISYFICSRQPTTLTNLTNLLQFQRLRTENRLLRQRVDLLEQESSDLADRLIQGQVTRAEVEETTFAIKRELAAIKQHDLDTNAQLEEARERYDF